MVKQKKSKEERKRDREILDLYHKKLTEDELALLYEKFHAWKTDDYPYYQLAEDIHQFHKKNQEIWKMFNYGSDSFLIFQAKKDLNILSDEEKEKYHDWSEDW